MTHNKALHTALLIFLLSAVFCGCGDGKKKSPEPVENLKAKAMLAGIWIDADEETVVFRIKGDTVYYPDSTSQPVAFKIFGDTMVLYGNNSSKYPIVKQDVHIFEFRNQNNDVIKLVKSADPNDSLLFVRHRPIVLNQGKVIKNDTVVWFADVKYHSYVQVNPTTYKVFRPFYNAEGMEIENIYYDNIIHISIFKGAQKLFSKDFTKADFAEAVPANMLKQSILSDIKLASLRKAGFCYLTQLAIPDSPSSFIVELIITYDGKTYVRVVN